MNRLSFLRLLPFIPSAAILVAKAVAQPASPIVAIKITPPAPKPRRVAAGTTYFVLPE